MINPRNIEFIGNHQRDSILIGNYGDAKITVLGNFTLAGRIYCRRNTVEFNITGEGTARFEGICKKISIKQLDENCTLDLRNISCQTVRLEGVKNKAVILLGNVRLIEFISKDENAIVRYEGKPLIINASFNSDSRIENLKSVA